MTEMNNLKYIMDLIQSPLKLMERLPLTLMYFELVLNCKPISKVYTTQF